MFKIVCVTNRKLCERDFLEQIENVAKCKPDMIVLREKDLDEETYEKLARQVIAVCNKYGVLCVLHHFVQVALRLQHNAIHLPLYILKEIKDEEKKFFKVLGSSCHSVEEAMEAEKLGCTYIFAGHIYETNCKRGLKGRGLDFLKAICNSISIPVFGIGGIHKDNVLEVINVGANGVALMSGFMRATDVYNIYNELL